MRTESKFVFDEDTRLMLKASDGIFSAFITLYKRYFRIVMDYLASLNGHISSLEDYAQIVFLRIWQNRKKFRGDSTFKTYLFGVARNVLLEDSRRLAREIKAHQGRLRELALQVSDAPLRPESEAHLAELIGTVKHAKAQLTAEQKQALELYYAERMSLREAAEQANCSEDAIESRLRRACEQLRQSLKSSGSNKWVNFGQDHPSRKKKSSSVTP
ncbi:MAG: RNA polymerase sigma factor [Candidatus Peribacteraceae bacterium]|nr:RNA polymerase sigma factor [Candidatus Peribacteraceae bacterium]